MKIAIIRVNKEWIFIVQVAGVNGEWDLNICAICALVEIIVVKINGGRNTIIVIIVIYADVSALIHRKVIPNNIIVYVCNSIIRTKIKKKPTGLIIIPCSSLIIADGVIGHSDEIINIDYNSTSRDVSHIIADDVVGHSDGLNQYDISASPDQSLLLLIMLSLLE